MHGKGTNTPSKGIGFLIRGIQLECLRTPIRLVCVLANGNRRRVLILAIQRNQGRIIKHIHLDLKSLRTTKVGVIPHRNLHEMGSFVTDGWNTHQYALSVLFDQGQPSRQIQGKKGKFEITISISRIEFVSIRFTIHNR